MVFELNNQRDLGKQVRKVSSKQLDKAIKALRSGSRSSIAKDQAVHSARKRIKEVRALLKLVRDGVGRTQFERHNKTLRDAARPLSEVRDAAALIEAVRSLEQQYSREVKQTAFKSVHSALLRRRRDIRRRVLKKSGVLAKSAAAVSRVRNGAGPWKLKRRAWKVLQAGLSRAYEKGHAAMANALKDLSDENLHEWRKRVKDLRYQLELLQPLWPAVMKVTAEQAKALTDLLGNDHDLATLHALLAAELKETLTKEVVETLQGLIDGQRADLQHSAVSLGEKLFAESPEQFVDRLGVYWKTDRQQKAVA